MTGKTKIDMVSRWSFLAPRFSTLSIQYKTVPPDDDPRGPPGRILKVSLPHRPHFSSSSHNAKFRESYEALALLAAVEHIDYESWRYCLEKLCKLRLGERGEERFEDTIPVKFLIEVDLEQDASGKYDLVTMCGVNHRLHPDTKYLKILQKITAIGKKKSGVDIKIPVRISVSDEKHLKDAAKAEKIIKEQWQNYYQSGLEQEVESGSIRCTFQLEPIVADFHRIKITDEIAQTMGTLLEEKMNFSHVQLELHLIRMIAYDEIKSRTTLATLIPRLFDTTGDRHRLGQEVQPQIGALTLSCDTGVIGVRNFERMCSALRLCQTTRKLSLDLSISPTAPYTSKIWWKWLAYSLFSKRARSYSTIDSVALILEEKVTVADMNALCAVLGSDFPEEELLGCSGGQVGGREATLEANTPIKWQMTKQGTPRSASKELRFSFPIPFVRTLRDDGASGWVDVIIPGLAWCQVQRSCLKFSVCEPQTLSSNNITSLSITFRTKVTSNAASLVRFLGAIGTTLKHLTIDGSGLEVDENVVLEKCPNLCTLSLRGKWFDAELDFSHYRGVGEAIPSIKCYQLDVRTLAGILGDNDEPLTKCLHRLRVHHERNKLTASALLQMLTTNETLAFLEIGGYLKMSNFDEFRQHHLEPIKRTRNISKESKLAFLSVLSSHQTCGQAKKRAYRSTRIDGVMWNLDQYVLSKIFAFAGPPILRQVFCKIDHTYVQQQDVVNYYSESDTEDDWDGFYLEFHRRPRSWEPYTFAHGWGSDDSWDSEDSEF